jgi:hypothetical protein
MSVEAHAPQLLPIRSDFLNQSPQIGYVRRPGRILPFVHRRVPSSRHGFAARHSFAWTQDQSKLNCTSESDEARRFERGLFERSALIRSLKSSQSVAAFLGMKCNQGSTIVNTKSGRSDITQIWW